MTSPPRIRSLPGFLTGPRTSWAVLLGCAVAIALGIAFVPHPVASEIINPATVGDSARVAQWQANVPAADLTNAIVVWTRADGSRLTVAQRQLITARANAVVALSPQVNVPRPQLSADRRAILAFVPVRTASLLKDATAVSASITETARAGLPTDLRARVAGDVETLAADARAGDSANGILPILWLIVLSALVLLLATRSLLLWLAPLVVTISAAFLGEFVGRAGATVVGLPVAGVDAPLLLAVTIGVGTACSSICLSRARTDRRSIGEPGDASARAWRAVSPPIAANALVLVAGAVVFLFAEDSRWRALGLAAAIGIALVTLAVLIAVPAADAAIGRLAPSARRAQKAQSVGLPATRDARQWRSAPRTFVTIALIAVVAVGGAAALVAATAPPRNADAASARAAIDRSYARGYGNETILLVPRSLRDKLTSKSPSFLTMSLPNAHMLTPGPSHAGRSALFVYFNIDPGSAQSFASIRTLRRVLATAGDPTAESLVGGSDAAAVDRSDALASLDALSAIAVVLVLLLLLLGHLIERRFGSRSE
jgi:putative drug exporter of the RND superfamily